MLVRKVRTCAPSISFSTSSRGCLHQHRAARPIDKTRNHGSQRSQHQRGPGAATQPPAQWNGSTPASADASAGQRTVSLTPPLTGACASLSSVTTSTVPARRSMRCDGDVVTVSPTFCSVSVRAGPVSEMVPSTVRSSPSENAARAGAGAGCGSISPHHAPSSSHNKASGSHAMRCARVAATPHKAAISASAIDTRLGRSHNRLATAIPAANSHAAWKSGTAVKPDTCCVELGERMASGSNLKTEFAVKRIRK